LTVGVNALPQETTGTHSPNSITTKFRRHARVDRRNFESLPLIKSPSGADLQPGAFRMAIQRDGVTRWHLVEVTPSPAGFVCVAAPVTTNRTDDE
jgi:hypothetical protein